MKSVLCRYLHGAGWVAPCYPITLGLYRATVFNPAVWTPKSHILRERTVSRPAEDPGVINAQLGPYLVQAALNALLAREFSFKLLLTSSTRHVNQAQEVGAWAWSLA